jgi:hypothetical protein
MRLINVHTLALEEFFGEIPPYAILSHTWEKEEVSFEEFSTLQATSKSGYEKIRMCCDTAKLSDIDYVWVDTCCIGAICSDKKPTFFHLHFSKAANTTTSYDLRAILWLPKISCKDGSNL